MIYKFYSPTCGPCKVLERNLQKTNLEYQSIDITDESNEELIEKYNIQSIPVLLKVDENGIELHRSKGVLAPDLINEYFG